MSQRPIDPNDFENQALRELLKPVGGSEMGLYSPGENVGGVQDPAGAAPNQQPQTPQTRDPYAAKFIPHEWGGETRPDRVSFKQEMGRVLNQYDPKAGVTPEVLKALNDLGFAEFYSPEGSKGDRLGYRNITEKGRAADIRNASGFEGDFIGNFGADNAGWQFDWEAPADEGGGGGFGGGMLPGQGLQSAIPSDQGFFRELLKRLQQDSGLHGFDREALMGLLR